MRHKQIGWLVLVLAALIVWPNNAAQAKELGRVVISGPGLSKPIEITDPQITNQLGPDTLDNFEQQVSDRPKDVGDSFYNIDRGYADESGNVQFYDHLRYYLNTQTGKGGYIFYIALDGGQSSNTGKWFLPRPDAEAILHNILAQHGVTDTMTAQPLVTIAGPGLAKPIEITDPQIASPLWPMNIENLAYKFVTAPKDAADPHYTIDWGYVDQTGKMFPYQHLSYYPNPKTGWGYILYIGMDGADSVSASQWFYANREEEAALRKILTDHGVIFALAAQPGVNPQAAPETGSQPVNAAPQTANAAIPTPILPLIAGGVVLLVGLGVGIALARSRARRRHA